MAAVDGRGNRVPDYSSDIKELRSEIRGLWQALAKEKALPPVQKQMPFSWSGTVSGTKLSGPWYTESHGTITSCVLGFAGGGSGTVTLLINGANIRSFYISGTRGGTSCRIPYRVTDRVQLQVSASGTDLTAILTYITDKGW